MVRMEQLTYNKPIELKVNSHGYQFFQDKDHLLASKGGRVLYHRHVISLALGRWIIPKELVHHIDHDKSNNEISNLEIMTRSEHSSIHNPKKVLTKHCPKCGIKYSGYLLTKSCEECATNPNRKFLGTQMQLQQLLWIVPTVLIGRMFGVSDKAIEKRAKKWGLSKPPRGYWAKKTFGHF